MISSLTNNKVKNWLKLRQVKYRNKFKKFIIEEEHVIAEAIKTNNLETLILLEGSNNQFGFTNVEIVSKDVMKKLSSNISLNKMIGIANVSQNSLESNRVLLLDDIQIPGNMGTILRTAHSLGYNKIFVSEGCVDVYNDKVIKASQGAIFHLDIEECSLLKVIEKSAFPIYATGFENSVLLDNVVASDKLGIIVGNEGSGVAPELIAKSHQTIQIPVQQFDSLNVAVAAAICMYGLREK